MNKLREHRIKSHLSQDKLGKLVGTTQGTIGLYERGQREPSLLMISKLSKALNCTPTELFPILDVKHNGWESKENHKKR